MKRAHDFVLDLSSGANTAERLLVHASPLSHGVPTVGYVIGELARARRLDSVKAKALGASGTELGRLKRGLDVVHANGTTIRASQVLSDPPLRRSVCVLQDTMESKEAEDYLTSSRFPCQLSLLIHECTYDAASHELAVLVSALPKAVGIKQSIKNIR